MPFKHIEGETAVVALGGVFKVCDLYERDGKLFAAVAGGFVRLYENGSTSKPKLLIESIQIDAPLYRDRFGRLCTEQGEGRTALSSERNETLLLGKD